MKRIKLYLIIIISLSTGIITGQKVSNDTSEVLEELYTRLVNNFDDNTRIQINDSIRLIISSYVKSDMVFNNRFDNLRYLGQIISPDSLLKIVTWNLVLSSSSSRYYCYIIRKEKAGGKSRIYSLTTAYKDYPIKTDTVYSESDWYGALYYDIKPYISGDKKYWVLLGIDYGNPSVSRKIIEVLSFTPDGSIIFGKKWFVSGEKTKFRDVFEYISDALMTLRFNSASSIIFNHLVSFSADIKNDRQYFAPDYSFDAYNFENGLWKMTYNVDVRNKE